MKYFCGLPLVLFFVGSLAQSSVGELVQDFQKTKQDIVKGEVKQRQVMSSLFEINKVMKKVVTEKSNLDQQRLAVESSNQDLAQRILDLEDKMKIQKNLLRERISVIYKLGGQGFARLIFSSNDSTQLERNLKIVGIIAKQDLDLIKDYSATMHELAAKKEKLVQRLAYLKKLEKNIQDKESKLVSENNSKNHILNTIRNSKNFALLKLNKIRKKSLQTSLNDDSGVFDLLFQPSFFEQKGFLPTPIQGTVLQKFGLIKDDEQNVALSHKGLFFAASKGTPVKAIFPGKVAFNGLLPGFGRTLIIDHGDHYYSVYGCTREASVQEGDEVSQHQIIARSGVSTQEFGEGLYFEIRHFSEPYDPQQWMKGTAL